MHKDIKFKFQAGLAHQVKAIESVVDVLKGFTFSSDEENVDNLSIVSNFTQEYDLNADFLFGNLQDVQINNDLAVSQNLEFNKKSNTLNIERFGTHSYPVYTVEMETGTGKTYVYLKSIFELNKAYGFSKFVIVVPSVAIWEGVLKNIEQTRQHFRMIYGKGFNPYVLKGKNINALKNFAIDTNISVLILTIDSFNKVQNQVYRTTDSMVGSSLLPIEYVQKTRPILILDESQNYLTDIAQKALSSLKPLVAYNFSATPKEKPNLIYYLSPVDALKHGLVKRIQVLGVTDEDDQNTHLGMHNLTLEDVVKNDNKIEAKLKAYVIKDGLKKKKTIKLKVRDSISKKTKNTEYEGLIVENIKLRPKSVIFENGDTLRMDEKQNTPEEKESLFREQIRQTIKFHIAKQRSLKEKSIKVLSVFFIDRVSSYISEDGLIKKLFDEEFEKLKKNYDHFKELSAQEVRDGYFSQVSINNTLYYVDEIEDKYDKKTLDKIKKSQQMAQKKSFELIMKNKEELLSFDNDKCFIFAHSALKEGWDNPNVFQICTLRETPSDDTKRQIVGRGMRLAVDQNGNRCLDEDVNILTVIPNESYKSFCSNLQLEYESNGDVTPTQPRNAKKSLAERNNSIFKREEFREFWKKLSSRSKYLIKINTEELISECVAKFNSMKNDIPNRKITLSFGEFSITRVALRLVGVQEGEAEIVVTRKNTREGLRKITDRYRVGDILDSEAEGLKDYKIVEIIDRGESSMVSFTNGQTLSFDKKIKFHVSGEIDVEESEKILTSKMEKNVNFIKRAMEATSLTRKTLVAIYKNISDEKKRLQKINPEGFSNAYVKVVQSTLSDHIAKNIEYEISHGELQYDIEEMFPEKVLYVQREVINGSENSLYNQIQIDSQVEERFVLNKLHQDDGDGNIVAYFKFPPGFRISLPKVIGNYNPDWGVIRQIDSDKKVVVELVRETKGSEDISKLQRSSEGHKIKCAEKYFSKLGVNYRHVTDKTSDWMD
ncbi:DEAD/DEAH box helicase family protein [Halobacteriovorax sp. YZS-1-1]|uniref:restriction endonuclease n=1 Tax=unclassified Halobacteriovorax TaxID=2639665 RepID=UPI00399C10A8